MQSIYHTPDEPKDEWHCKRVELTGVSNAVAHQAVMIATDISVLLMNLHSKEKI